MIFTHRRSGLKKNYHNPPQAESRPPVAEGYPRLTHLHHCVNCFLMRFPLFGAVSLALLAACSTLVSKAPVKPQEPPKAVVLEPPAEAPFRREQKIEIPADAQAMAHFVKGQMLLTEGEFDPGLAEFQAAAAADPTNAFLRFRLATLFVRKGDLKQALKEGEEAARLAPECSDTHLLLAGLYSSLG